MPREDVEYFNVGVFVGQVDAETTTQNSSSFSGVTNLTDISYDIDIPTQDVSIAGRAGSKKINNEAPTANLNFTYYTVDLYNEAILGLTIDSTISCLSAIMQKQVDSRNYFIPIAGEGIDLEGAAPADYEVVGIGNGYLSSYSFSASVGNLAQSTVAIQGSNLASYSDGVGEALPSVDSDGMAINGTFTLPNGIASISGQPIALGQGDITVDVTNNADKSLFYSPTGVCIQGVDISFDLNRSAKSCLGSKYPTSRKANYPIAVNFSIDALAKDLVTGNANNIICDPNANAIDLSVTLYKPSCDAARGPAIANFTLKNAIFQGLSASVSQGDTQGKTVTLNYQGSISSSGDIANGLFMSGVYGYNAGNGISSS